jgi:threonylcarbamoyladenosine tRNA methylthiotransferase MtaB
MTLLRVAFQTLGCKLNQLETESVADKFLDAGAEIVPFHVPADLYVVNTCTVTSKAEQKARHDIRAALARVPHAVVVATGCYAQMEPAALTALGERVIVISGDLKASLLSLARWLSDNWQGHGELFHAVLEWQAELRGDTSSLDRFAFHPERFAMHSRPALKVQDGCNNRCSFCRVCLARGPSVSLPAREALARVRRLEEAGKAEVVLTGVNLAQYRSDGFDFSGLLSFLAEETSSIKFRISSYEPERVDDALLAAFANPRVRPHMHLSVQAGCTDTLRRMARPYGAEEVRRAVQALRAVRDDPFLAADIIAGFPGETETEFESTFSLLSELDFAWIHAFPFSPRPGTRAAAMRPHVPERVAGLRVERLLALAGRGKAAYIGRWLGREVEMVVEHETADAPRIIGTTENYLKAEIIGNGNGDIPPGGAVRIVIQEESRSRHAEITAYRAATA